MRILISACLLGEPCRYDGLSKPLPDETLDRLMRGHTLIPVCPEQLGGLPTPRTPSERQGDRVVMRDGKDVTLYASGFTVGLALDAAELLAAEGISARVVNVATIKPLDVDEIASSAAETGAFVTVEEHNVIGGLGEAVAAAAAQTRPVPVLRVGTEDVFGKSGKVPALLEAYGLTPANVAAKAKAAIALK